MGKLKDFEKKIKETYTNNCVYTGVIYCYTNLINGKKYIGQTLREKDRISEHKRKSCKGSNLYFHNALRRYGYENFIYEILYKRDYLNIEDASVDLDLWEIYYINKFNSTNHNNGYNKMNGGGIFFTTELQKKIVYGISGENNPFFGKHHTEEARKKMSIAHKGKPLFRTHPFKGKKLSEEHKRKIGETLKGRIISEECKKKIKETWTEEKRLKQSERMKGENHPLFGKHLTNESKQKLSDKAKLRWANEEVREKARERNRDKMKPIIQYDLKGNIIREWESAHEAARSLNILQSGIQHCCKGRFKTYKSYIWGFKYEEHRN